MAEIPMAAIPKHMESLAQLIYKAYERKNESSGPMLTRMGASGIGKECLREIWYDWRGFSQSKPEGRMLRLFKTGYIQEDRVVQDLKDAGLEVWEVNPETGKQWTYITASGHFVCKTDGVCRGVPGAEKVAHVLEIKSSNKKGFDALHNRGVQKEKPMHYWQMQAGMHLSGLDRALYVAVCKDDEKFYIERVVRDDSTIEQVIQKIDELRYATIPPVKLGEKTSDWRCKFCNHIAVCHQGQAPIKNCRTCQNSTPVDNGEWVCEVYNAKIPYDNQLKGCAEWKPY